MRCAHKIECKAAFPRDIYAFCYVQKPQLRIEIHRYTYINPGVSPSKFAPLKQNQIFDPLHIIDSIVFY